MNRVTKKVRKVRSQGAREHLVYTSAKHAEDKAAADRLREVRYVRVPAEPRVAPEPFPRAAELAWQVGVGSGTARMMSPEDFTAHLATARSDAAVWYTESKTLKKNGEKQLQKRKGEGLSDCYFSFPPWYTFWLAALVEAGEIETVKKITGTAVHMAAGELKKRTGYRVVGYALHPDNRNALGFHVQFQTAYGGRLLGRSSDGKKGRKGLRLAGDVMSAVARMSEYVAVRDHFGVLAPGRDYDDLAVHKVLDAVLKKQFGAYFPEFLPDVEENAAIYSKIWAKGQELALSGPEEVERLRKALEEEVENRKALEGKLQRAETEVASLKDVRDLLQEAVVGVLEREGLFERLGPAMTAEYKRLTTPNQPSTPTAPPL